MSDTTDLDLVPITLVPVEVFGDDCECHEETGHLTVGGHNCPGWSFGLSDAVQAWSDCNRAYGHTYRVDDVDSKYRSPDETVVVYVPRESVAWFERRWGEVSEMETR